MNKDKFFKYLALMCYIGIICLFLYNSYTLYLKGVLSSDLMALRFVGISLTTVLFFTAQRNLQRYVYGKETRI
jgi:hypothetical protein